MSAYKQFLASDIIVTPFTVNKGFSFPSSQFATGSDGQLVGIDRFLGTNVDWFTNKATTGTLTTEYQGLVYNSVKQLYYSNFLSSSIGDNATQPTLIPGSDPSGNRLVGDIKSPLYDNYLQSTLTPTRFFPTSSGAEIGIISIPSKLYGEYIVPGSLTISSGSSILVDDGEGNIVISGSTLNYGNVIYTQGIVVLTNSASYAGGGTVSLWGSAVYGTSTWGAMTVPPISGFISGGITCSFTSAITIYETQYKCTLLENEFNLSLNPSLNSGSEGNVYSFVTASYFSPYVTTVGLYDDAQNLLAIGKLAQPLPTSDTTDTTILINLDM
jgi:hypothetical protein